jgi:serine/threonine protein kinase
MITRIVDIVKDKDNFPWIIMKKCNQSLQDIITIDPEEPIPENKILRIFTMISIGLLDIHSKKIVHRDLKPANILWRNIGT